MLLGHQIVYMEYTNGPVARMGVVSQVAGGSCWLRVGSLIALACFAVALVRSSRIWSVP